MPIATLKAVAEDVLKTLFDRGEIWHWTIPNWKEVFGCEIASRSLIDNGLRISDQAPRLARNRASAAAWSLQMVYDLAAKRRFSLRFNCKNLGRK